MIFQSGHSPSAAAARLMSMKGTLVSRSRIESRMSFRPGDWPVSSADLWA